jgi:mRNA interferase MazF
MRRGDICAVADGSGYAGKPRPAVVVQDDRFLDAFSIVICPFTSDPTDAPIVRLVVQPSELNRLKTTSRLMVDKLTAVRASKVGGVIGRLDEEDILRLNRAIVVFLGLAG